MLRPRSSKYVDVRMFVNLRNCSFGVIICILLQVVEFLQPTALEVKDGAVPADPESDILKLSVVERYGKNILLRLDSSDTIHVHLR